MEIANLALASDPNLKAYYRFTAGSLLVDSSGNGNTLTNVNAVAETVNGKYGGGANFGNTNTDKRLTQGNLGIAGGDDISIAFHYKRPSEITTGAETLIAHANTSGDRVIQVSYQYNGGTPRLEIYDGVSSFYNVSLGTGFHSLLFIRDITVTSKLKLYLDGVLVINANLSSASASGFNVFSISGDVTGTNPFSGIMDDIGVFNRPLTAQEAIDLATESSPSLSPSSSISRSPSASVSPSSSVSLSPSASQSPSSSISRSPSSSTSPSASLSPSPSSSVSVSVSASVSPSSSPSPSPVENTLSVDLVCVSFITVYANKYATQSTIYSNAYVLKSTVYTDKYISKKCAC